MTEPNQRVSSGRIHDQMKLITDKSAFVDKCYTS